MLRILRLSALTIIFSSMLGTTWWPLDGMLKILEWIVCVWVSYWDSAAAASALSAFCCPSWWQQGGSGRRRSSRWPSMTDRNNPESPTGSDLASTRSVAACLTSQLVTPDLSWQAQLIKWKQCTSKCIFSQNKEAGRGIASIQDPQLDVRRSLLISTDSSF